MKIEFGCGAAPTKHGFKTCDIRDLPGIDFVCPAWEIDKLVGENSVDEIFSRHFFEHLTFLQGEKMLSVWYKILKPGSKCEMTLPNMSFHIEQWINRRNKKEFAHALAGFWGWQREGDTELWDVHKSGYDQQMLSNVISKKGFISITSHLPDNDKELHFSFIKPK